MEAMSGMERALALSHVHPLLIPFVSETIASNLEKTDLLMFRSVCRTWLPIGNDEYKSRESIKGTIGGRDDFPVRPFLTVMTPSTDPPVVRFEIKINLFILSSSDLIDLLVFIAPFVRGIDLIIQASKVPDVSTPDAGIEQVNNLLPKLTELGLAFPRLENFYLDFSQVIIYSVGMSHPFGRAVKGLAETFKKGAGDTLKCYSCRAFGRHGHFLKELPIPKGAKTLIFDSAGNLPHDQLIMCDLGLEQFEVQNTTNVKVIEFLYLQRDTLTRLSLANLEQIYQTTYPNFPELKAVKKVSCDVKCTSNFDFLSPFPFLTEATFLVKRRPCGVSNTHGVPIEGRSQYPKVRRLRVYYQYDLVGEDAISLLLLSHVFPNLTKLSLSPEPVCGFLSGLVWRALPGVFAHMSDLQHLSIKYTCDDRGDEISLLGTSFVGLPQEVCDRMKTRDTFDDAMIPSDTDIRPGLSALKKLKILELDGTSDFYDAIFTKVAFHRVWVKMESLKELCFLHEIPDACQPFVDRLIAKGIDIYRMKRWEDKIP